MICTWPKIVPRRQFSLERCPALWSSFAASVCVIRVPPSSSGRSCPGQVRQHRPRHHDHLERGVHDVVWPKAVAVVANRPVKHNCNIDISETYWHIVNVPSRETVWQATAVESNRNLCHTISHTVHSRMFPSPLNNLNTWPLSKVATATVKRFKGA